jgi:hypothetical protein
MIKKITFKEFFGVLKESFALARDNYYVYFAASVIGVATMSFYERNPTMSFVAMILLMPLGVGIAAVTQALVLKSKQPSIADLFVCYQNGSLLKKMTSTYLITFAATVVLSMGMGMGIAMLLYSVGSSELTLNPTSAFSLTILSGAFIGLLLAIVLIPLSILEKVMLFQNLGFKKSLVLSFKAYFKNAHILLSLSIVLCAIFVLIGYASTSFELDQQNMKVLSAVGPLCAKGISAVIGPFLSAVHYLIYKKVIQTESPDQVILNTQPPV